MNFKLPNHNFNDEHIKLLEDVHLSQKNLLANCEDLRDRISNLEQAQCTFSDSISHLQQQIHSDNLHYQSFSVKLKLNIFLNIVIILLICASLTFVGLHFWDVPSQTQAANNYIYNQIIKDTDSQHSH